MPVLRAVHPRSNPFVRRPKSIAPEAQAKQIEEEWFIRNGGSHEQFLAAKKQLGETKKQLSERLARTTDPMEIANILIEDGLANGSHPTEVARKICSSTSGISRDQAAKMAHTGMMRAHAERMLDSMQPIHSDGGGKLAWSTAGDDGVCQVCAAMEGKVFRVNAARGLIPNANCTCADGCRCCWTPIVELKS